MEKTTPMKKTALDESAKKYWKLLFKDLGYGEALVRDIPRRIKAALQENKKVASIDESADIMPVAHAMTENGAILEGLYKDSKVRLMFQASLDKDGNITGLKSFGLR